MSARNGPTSFSWASTSRLRAMASPRRAIFSSLANHGVKSSASFNHASRRFTRSSRPRDFDGIDVRLLRGHRIWNGFSERKQGSYYKCVTNSADNLRISAFPAFLEDDVRRELLKWASEHMKGKQWSG